MNRFYKLFTIFILIGLLTAQFPATAYALPASTILPQNQLLEDCDTIDEDSLRDELNLVAQEALESNSINMERIVRNQWTALDIDETLDDEVDKAVERVRSEEDYLGRLWSGWSANKAKELAEKVANYAFSSQGFRDAITELSVGVAEEITLEMESASARSASSALLCMQDFIGQQYSDNMTTLFEIEIAKTVGDVNLDEIDSDVSIVGGHSKALAGIGVIIGTQIAKRLAKKLAERLAGKIVGRILGRTAASFVPVAGWIVGAGLIVWDLVEGGNGALPQIQDSLKSYDIKDEIRAEVVAAVGPEIDRELPQIAREVADDIYSTWLDFRTQYQTVLDLAAQNANFKTILDDSSTDQIYLIGRAVTLSLDTIGEAGLMKAIDDGTMARFAQLPESALSILEGTLSMQRTIEWADLAGSMLDDVAQLEIHKLKYASDFTRDSLAKIITVDDRTVVTKLLALESEKVDTLLALPTETLKDLSVNFTSDDLNWLSSYLAQIESLPNRAQLVNTLIQSPNGIKYMKDERILTAIQNGEDVDKILTFVATDDGPQTLLNDLFSLSMGSVSPIIFWYKYRGSTNLILFPLGLIFGLWVLTRLIRGIFFGGRKRKKAEEPPAQPQAPVAPPQEYAVQQGQVPQQGYPPQQGQVPPQGYVPQQGQMPPHNQSARRTTPQLPEQWPPQEQSPAGSQYDLRPQQGQSSQYDLRPPQGQPPQQGPPPQGQAPQQGVPPQQNQRPQQGQPPQYDPRNDPRNDPRRQQGQAPQYDPRNDPRTGQGQPALDPRDPRNQLPPLDPRDARNRPPAQDPRTRQDPRQQPPKPAAGKRGPAPKSNPLIGKKKGSPPRRKR